MLSSTIAFAPEKARPQLIIQAPHGYLFLGNDIELDVSNYDPERHDACSVDQRLVRAYY